MKQRGAKKYVVVNFAYGSGPYLRATSVALALNMLREKAGKEISPIIVPLTYGERQKKVMVDEFGAEPFKSRAIIFDRFLGTILRAIFFEHDHFKDALDTWVGGISHSSSEIENYFSGTLKCEDFDGRSVEVKGGDVIIEIARSPRVNFGRKYSYWSSFGHLTEIYSRALAENRLGISRRLLIKAKAAARDIEGRYHLHALTDPHALSFEKKRKPLLASEFLTPPILLAKQKPPNGERGIYVLVSGIPSLEKIYREATKFGLTVYSNFPESLPGSVPMSPKLLHRSRIDFQFARAGWGTISSSIQSGVPLVTPDYIEGEDPEILYNIRTVEKIGIGLVYKGQTLAEIRSALPVLKKNLKSLKESLIRKYGSMDGVLACAERFGLDLERAEV